MALLDPSPPPSLTTSQATTNGLPQWYQDYIRGIGGKAIDIGTGQANSPLPARSVAGFNPDQLNAAQNVRQNMGIWQPHIAEATGFNNQLPGVASGAAGQANGIAGQGALTAYGNATGAAGRATGAAYGAAGSANGDVAGNPEQFPDAVARYMSPYTDSVVNNIARLGNRNFSENIMPGIDDAMLGSGQFGSTRNADVLGRAGRDVQADITGAQANALESGYGMAGQLFGQDASRLQQQQQMQASTALQGGALTSGTELQGGQLGASTALQGASLGANTALQGGGMQVDALGRATTNAGALGQTYAQLAGQDAASLGAIGNQQQALQQMGLDTQFQNDTAAYNAPFDTLNNVSSVVRGMQLPSTQVSSASGPASNLYNPSALGGLGTVFGAMRSNTPAPTATRAF